MNNDKNYIDILNESNSKSIMKSNCRWDEIYAIYNTLAPHERRFLGNRFIDSPNTVFRWIIQCNGENAGYMELYDMKKFGSHKKEVVVSTAICPQYRGIGILEELEKEAENFVYNSSKYNKMVWYAKDDNPKSFRCAEKLGYTKRFHELDHWVFDKTIEHKELLESDSKELDTKKNIRISITDYKTCKSIYEQLSKKDKIAMNAYGTSTVFSDGNEVVRRYCCTIDTVPVGFMEYSIYNDGYTYITIAILSKYRGKPYNIADGFIALAKMNNENIRYVANKKNLASQKFIEKHPEFKLADTTRDCYVYEYQNSKSNNKKHKELLDESNESFLSLNFYHASPSKYDKVIKPIAPNYGTKLYDPHWAVYMWKDKSLAYPYCLFTYIHKFMLKNFSKEERKDKFLECIKYGIYYMTKDVYKALKEHCVGKIAYIYTINVPLKDFIHIKLGHTNNFPEYSLDKEATIINREEIKITEKYFDKYVVVASVSNIKKLKKELAKEKEKNLTNILYNTKDDAYKVSYKFYIANAHGYLDTNKDLNKVLSNDELMIEAFNKELNTADYGILINGKVYTGKNIDWSKYKTISPKDFEKYYAGVCWDYAEYEAKQFEEIFGFKHTLNDLKEKEYSMYYMHIEDNNMCPSHTWIVYKLNGKIYVFESSWMKHQGITKYNTEEEMMKDYIKKLRLFSRLKDDPIIVTKYNRNTKFGLTPSQFMRRCIREGKVIYSEIPSISVDESYEKMPMILSEDDVYCNMSKFKNPYNIIFVCGTSGSGKSTLSKQIRDMYNIQWVSLDSLMFWLVKKERSPEDVLNQDPVLYKYLVEHNIDFNYLYNKYGNADKLKKLGLKKVKELGSNKEIRKMTVDFCEWISKQKDLYCVVEGLQTTFLHDNKEFILYPFIFKGTSMLKAWYRRIKRDNSSIWLTPSRWEDAVRWTKEWKHDVDRLRKAVISNSNDIYTKKEEDIYSD